MVDEGNVPVYRNVDGDLVRVAGDKRDPNRRYAHVCSAEGSYYREFTDEEEQKRDEEEAQWAADAPKREAEKKRKEEEWQKFQESLEYEDRIVAFVDVLGWKQAIERSLKDETLTRQLGIALNSVKGQAGLINWTIQNSENSKWPGDPQITHMSDCVVLSVSCDRYGQDALFNHLRPLVSQMLRLGFLVRGGITAGPLLHRDSMVYGPALVRAYELESKVAEFPRIIVDSPLADVWGVGPRFQHKDGSLIGYEKRWRRDFDGWSFLDFLQPFPSVPPVNHKSSYLDATFRPVRDLVIRALAEHVNNTRIFSKYQWTAKYFNSVIKEHPLCTIKKISDNLEA